jgi:hypothetical protein
MLEHDGLYVQPDFDAPCYVLLRGKIGDNRPNFRLTPEEARTLARRLNALADQVEPVTGDKPLGKPCTVWGERESVQRLRDFNRSDAALARTFDEA